MRKKDGAFPMSRHTLKAKDPNVEVTVGYDRPLDNFFSQVAARSNDLAVDEDGEGLVHWEIGTHDLRKLARDLAPWADVPSEVLHVLRAERVCRHSHPQSKHVDWNQDPEPANILSGISIAHLPQPDRRALERFATDRSIDVSEGAQRGRMRLNGSKSHEPDIWDP